MVLLVNTVMQEWRRPLPNNSNIINNNVEEEDEEEDNVGTAEAHHHHHHHRHHHHHNHPGHHMDNTSSPLDVDSLEPNYGGIGGGGAGRGGGGPRRKAEVVVGSHHPKGPAPLPPSSSSPPPPPPPPAHNPPPPPPPKRFLPGNSPLAKFSRGKKRANNKGEALSTASASSRQLNASHSTNAHKRHQHHSYQGHGSGTTRVAWKVLTSLYWKLLVALQLVLGLTDVANDDPGDTLMTYQRIYLLFLFSAAILIILAMYAQAIITSSRGGSHQRPAFAPTPSPLLPPPPPPPPHSSDMEPHCNCGCSNPSSLEDDQQHPLAQSNSSSIPTSSGANLMAMDVEVGSLASFHGTLRRAYINRQALTTTNFHIRLGAVVFGVATLIYLCFAIAVHATEGRKCIDDALYALPIILLVLCFLQIHFLFVNSQVLVSSLRGPAQFCFAHLLATNLALWMRTVADRSATNWVTFLSTIPVPSSVSEAASDPPSSSSATTKTHAQQSSSSHLGHHSAPEVMDTGGGGGGSSSVSGKGLHEEHDGTIGGARYSWPTVAGLWWTTLLPSEFERTALLTHCMNGTTLGRMWLQATPFLVPFLLQFCIISSCVFYVLWWGMGQEQHPGHSHHHQRASSLLLPPQLSSHPLPPPLQASAAAAAAATRSNRRRGASRRDFVTVQRAMDYDCHLENKGIFLGLLLLVGGIVVLVMYLVLRAQPQFASDGPWVVGGTLCLVLAVAIAALLVALVKIHGSEEDGGCPVPGVLPPLRHGASPTIAQPSSYSTPLDDKMTSVATAGTLLYALLGVLVATARRLETNAHALLLAHSALLLLSLFLQNAFLAVAKRRYLVATSSAAAMDRRGAAAAAPQSPPPLQVLLFANVALWLLDTFMTSVGAGPGGTHSASSSPHMFPHQGALQEAFYGPLLWGLLSHACAPLVALYRFHSAVQIYELWRRGRHSSSSGSYVSSAPY